MSWSSVWCEAGIVLEPQSCWKYRAEGKAPAASGPRQNVVNQYAELWWQWSPAAEPWSTSSWVSGEIICDCFRLYNQGSCAGLEFKASLEKSLNFRKLKMALNCFRKRMEGLVKFGICLSWKFQQVLVTVWTAVVVVKLVEELLRTFY